MAIWGHGKRLPRLAAFSILLLLAGCATGGNTPFVNLVPETAGSLVLPPPPETPRVRYLYSVRSPRPASPQGKAGALLSGFNADGDAGQDKEVFKSPISIAATPQGSLCIVDQADSLLLQLKTDSGEWKVLEPLADRPLSSLIGLSADAKGSLYLTDSVLGRVFRMGYDHGRLEPFAADYPFARPTGVAYDQLNDRVYVVDTVASKVIAFDPDGKKVGEFGRRGTSEGEFNYPTFIGCDRSGNIYIADTLNFRVQSFTADGEFRFSIGSLGDGQGQFSVPKGVAVAPDGTIYVVDGRLDRVQAFAPDGKFLFEFGASGSAPGQFWSPNGIYVDGKDRLYVCDYLNNRVQVFQVLGER
ncbi:MAG TPA: 6-bladed beta-propeller [Geobacteraceae bacterium]